MLHWLFFTFLALILIKIKIIRAFGPYFSNYLVLNGPSAHINPNRIGGFATYSQGVYWGFGPSKPFVPQGFPGPWALRALWLSAWALLGRAGLQPFGLEGFALNFIFIRAFGPQAMASPLDWWLRHGGLRPLILRRPFSGHGGLQAFGLGCFASILFNNEGALPPSNPRWFFGGSFLATSSHYYFNMMRGDTPLRPPAGYNMSFSRGERPLWAFLPLLLSDPLGGGRLGGGEVPPSYH